MSAPTMGTMHNVRLRVVDRARQVTGHTFTWPGTNLASVIDDPDNTDLSSLTSGQPLHLYLDAATVAGASGLGWPADLVMALEGWAWPRRLILVIPADEIDSSLFDTLNEFMDPVPAVAMNGFTGSAEQLELLPQLDHVVVDAEHPDLAALVEVAHQARTTVVADRALTAETWSHAFEVGADRVTSSLAPRDALRAPGVFTAGELHSFEMLALLDSEEPDLQAVTGLVAADPALSVSVLRLVNSPAMGLRRQVDSVRQATVLAGPKNLHAIAVRSLIGASRSPVDDLWAMLTRAMLVWDLSGDEAGYTVGMFSALADLRRFPPEWLAEQAKLSPTATAALCRWEGPIGQSIADAIGYDLGDMPRRHEGHEIAQARHAAAREALGIAKALAD